MFNLNGIKGDTQMSKRTEKRVEYHKEWGLQHHIVMRPEGGVQSERSKRGEYPNVQRMKESGIPQRVGLTTSHRDEARSLDLRRGLVISQRCPRRSASSGE